MNQIKFIDLFAGIGGTRLGFEKACKTLKVECQCVFTSEWDKHAQETYQKNFKEKPHGDIRPITTDQIPDHNVLLAGFPCQPFSIAGISKKNALGDPHGFKCQKQGNLFFEIVRIIQGKKPDVFLLENVKHLRKHDKGNTFKVIEHYLKNVLQYTVTDTIYDAQLVVPQHRERIFIVGFRDPQIAKNFKWPEIRDKKPILGQILESGVKGKYTLTDHLWDYLQKYKAKHQEKGNGFGYSLFGPNDVARTLSARYYKDGSEVLIKQRGKKNPRRLTPKECAQLMGFPKTFKIPVSDTQAYRQFGNSVVVPLVYEISKSIVKTFLMSDVSEEHNQNISISAHNPELSKEIGL